MQGRRRLQTVHYSWDSQLYPFNLKSIQLYFIHIPLYIYIQMGDKWKKFKKKTKNPNMETFDDGGGECYLTQCSKISPRCIIRLRSGLNAIVWFTYNYMRCNFQHHIRSSDPSCPVDLDGVTLEWTTPIRTEFIPTWEDPKHGTEQTLQFYHFISHPSVQSHYLFPSTLKSLQRTSYLYPFI